MYKYLLSSTYFRILIFVVTFFGEIIIFHSLSKPDDFLNFSNSNFKLEKFLNKAMIFEKNVGQTDPSIDFLYRGADHNLFLSASGILLNFNDESNLSTKVRFIGANILSPGKGHEEKKSKSNYLCGSKENWIIGIPNFGRVNYTGIYPGIDVEYYFKKNNMEFDFIVEPNANPDLITLELSGTENPYIDEIGNLCFGSDKNSVIYKKPIAWQQIGNDIKFIDVQYKLSNENIISLNIDEYDNQETLIIDPELVYSTYLGSSGSESFGGIAVDNFGSVYIAGNTTALDFPTRNAFQNELTPGMFSSISDVIITKFTPDGSDIEYSTYLGGRWDDWFVSIAVDANGRACITGTTASNDDPDTPETESFPIRNAYQEEIAGSSTTDAFVTMLNSTGNDLIYSTYLGGSGDDEGIDIAVDNSGYIYVTGTTFSSDFPVKNPYQANRPSYYFDTFVSKINPHAVGDQSLIFSTYLGGDLDDWAGSIAVDDNGCVYVTGKAVSTDFPTTENPIQNNKKGTTDAYVTKFSPDGASLIYSTYLGGEGDDEGKSIYADNEGNAYVCGRASQGFPVTEGAFMSSGYSFLSKLNSDGTDFIYSTITFANGEIAVNNEGQVYIVATKNVADISNPNFDAFVIRFNPEGSDTTLSFTFGGSQNDFGAGILIDEFENLYLAGTTTSTDLPTKNAFQSAYAGGGNDFYVAKFGVGEQPLFVRVLQDSLGRIPDTIRNTKLSVYQIDLSNPNDPLNFVNFFYTDNKGILKLPKNSFSPGGYFYLQAVPYSEPAVKPDHLDVNDWMYQVFIDNLQINKNGKIYAARFSSDEEDTTNTFMGHTSIGYNLLISVEWPASDNYIEELKLAFILASDLLFDITNGHAFFNSAAIYDNKKFWNSADIQIYANNTQWPEATPFGIKQKNGTLNLPPIHSMDNTSNLYMCFNEPIILTTKKNVHTIVHEFGHYGFGFYDEYRNEEGENIEIFNNYGFMDQSPFTEPWLSEMSSQASVGYEITEQNFRYNMTCWEFWINEFQKTPQLNYLPFHAAIYKPQTYGLSYILGPNEDIYNPNYSVGNMMSFILNTSSLNNPRPIVVMRKKSTGEIVGGASVDLQKPDGRFIQLGKTLISGNDKGKIRLLGLEPGDRILAGGGMRNRDYLFERIDFANNFLSKVSSADEEINIELKSLQGNYNLMPELHFDNNGKLIFSAQANKAFNGAASLEIITDSGESIFVDLSLIDDLYKAENIENNFSHSLLYFTSNDSLNNDFFIPINVSIISDLDNGLVLTPQNISLQTKSESNIENYILTTSIFPIPQDGLTEELIKASDLISLNTFPSDTEFNTIMSIAINADTLKAADTSALVIYNYLNEWRPITTKVNLEYGIVSAEINQSGFYMVFLDRTKSIVGIGSEKTDIKVPQNFQLKVNYPNPFNSLTNIEYNISKAGKVTLAVYDLLGNKIVDLINESQSPGTYICKFDGSNISSGVYFIKMNIENYQQVNKMILLK